MNTFDLEGIHEAYLCELGYYNAHVVEYWGYISENWPDNLPRGGSYD